MPERPAQLLVAEARTTDDADVLRELSNHRDSDVRAAVAGNPSTPSADLDVLTRDKSVEVRIAAAANTRTPYRSLHSMLLKDAEGSAVLAASRALEERGNLELEPGPPEPPDVRWVVEEDGVVAEAGAPLDLKGASLRFRVWHVNVTIHWSIVLVAALGLGVFTGWEIAAWAIAAVLAILLHEIGHALTGRAFGIEDVAITVFGLGGVTTWSPSSVLSPGRRFVMIAAGSGLGIAVGGALVGLAVLGALEGAGGLLLAGFEGFVFASLFWGALNWLPIRPLDGGQMTFTLLELVTPHRALLISRIVSVAVGAAVFVAAIQYEFYIASFFVVALIAADFRSSTGRGSSGSGAHSTEDTGASVETGASPGRTPLPDEPAPIVPMVDGKPIDPDERRPRKGLTVAWMTVALFGMFGVVGLVVGSFVFFESRVAVQNLEVADCVLVPDGAEISLVEVVPCDMPHDVEVFALISADEQFGAIYPSRLQLEDFAWTSCIAEFETYVGSEYLQSSLDVTFLYPSSEGWGAGDRRITCMLLRLDRTDMDRSMRGSGL